MTNKMLPENEKGSKYMMRYFSGIIKPLYILLIQSYASLSVNKWKFAMVSL